MPEALRVAIVDCTKTLYTEETAPSLAIGGIERCVINLARALTNTGVHVHVFNAVETATEYQGVAWSPLAQTSSFQADIVIACNDPHLFDRFSETQRQTHFKPVLWLHNPVPLVKTIRKGRLFPILKWRPTAVFLGHVQKKSTSLLIPFGKHFVIPHGVEKTILDYPVSHTAPPPHAAFISQAYRGLDEVIDIWINDILPHLPAPLAPQLDIYSQVVPRQGLDQFGISYKGRMPRAQLLSELSDKRVMFIPGHKDETFCLAAAESHCLGIPVISFGRGSLSERIIDQKNGFLAKTRKEFTESAIKLFTDDALWFDMHTDSIKVRTYSDWSRIASDWVSMFKTL